VPLYALKTGGSTIGAIKCDTSDRIVIGDSSEEIYFNTSGNIVVPDAGSITAGFTSKTSFLDWEEDVDLTLGAMNSLTTIQGEYLRMRSWVADKAGDPNTTDLPAGYWGIWRNSTSGAVYLAVNYSGTIKKVTLS
jgi:hypothetical protein